MHMDDLSAGFIHAGVHGVHPNLPRFDMAWIAQTALMR
jgi:hypothetical protein